MASQLDKSKKQRHLVNLPRLAGEPNPSEESAQWSSENGVSGNDHSPVDSVLACEDQQANKPSQRPSKATQEAFRSDLDGLANQAYRSLNLAQPKSPRKQRARAVDESHNVVDVPMSKYHLDRPSESPSRDMPASPSRHCPKEWPLPARHDSLAWDGKQQSCGMKVEVEGSDDVIPVLKRKDSGAQFIQLNEESLPAPEEAAPPEQPAHLDEVYYRAVLQACKLGRSRTRAGSQPMKPASPWARPGCPPDPLYHPAIASGLGTDLAAAQSQPMTPEIAVQSSQLSLAKGSDEEGVPEYIKQLEAHGLIAKKDMKNWNVRQKSGGTPKSQSKSNRNGKCAGHGLRGLLKKPQAASVRSLSLT
ncbi:hypothetical protein Tdes44962_MAKER00999 [Teratosphaeria destructans]|uniref:Uncharacterized protein n=1 Tax=Teratosphaeria destructans TaxID=418781 RepID=A0A9W7SK19_9PEZI|nr:hypothetical protein Tdes44962_MAKER00999 [Teratosphaeria destructans]